MRNELNAPLIDTLRTQGGASTREFVKRAEQLVDPEVGPIISYEEENIDEVGDSIFTRYLTVIQRTAVFSDTGYWEPGITSGSGYTATTAKAAALGEAIERYCLSICDLTQFRKAKYNDIETAALHPDRVNKFTDEQLEDFDLMREDILNSEYYWTATRGLSNGEKVLIPGQLVYLPFHPSVTIRSPTTTGAAAGINYESTLYRALCEAVERECFIIGYLNELEYPRIDLSMIEDEIVHLLQKELHSLGYEVYILNMSLDHPFRACLAIAIDEEDDTQLCLGMGCDLSMLDAIRGALLEAYQFSPWELNCEEPVDDPKGIETIPQRAEYWENHVKLSEIGFWLDSDTTHIETDTNWSGRKSRIGVSLFQEYLRENEMECYVSEVTTDDLTSRGLHVLKVVIPEFHPMHLIERYKYLGGERLYQVPVEMGFLNEPKTPENINKIPHPFL